MNKLVSLILLAPISLALASNPAACIKPQQLRNAYLSGVVHRLPSVKTCKDVKLNQWYSITRDMYADDMKLMRDPSMQFKDGGLGKKDKISYLCEYEASNGEYVDIQLITDYPAACNK